MAISGTQVLLVEMVNTAMTHEHYHQAVTVLVITTAHCKQDFDCNTHKVYLEIRRDKYILHV